MKKIEVVAAIIAHNKKILCTQRGPAKFEYISGKYEFPGGKVESGETNEGALVREISEELGLNVAVEGHYLTVSHAYPDFAIVMHSYVCTTESVEGMALTEHVDHRWLSPAELSVLDWAAADVPIVEKLQNEPNEFF
ncbi:(deoxy)nucleoside triphosphate pyrophosphohydrolase [Marinihelvus fidelis]|uniref:8-oxo-dGTP diphosphatase n=1 Tax=Marinihelvus fidelis TaxID=2613842 RepID=A0A5N0T9T4_9GAMM|nr:(deoxy)nucleoside triphosphate pyrophosphohydrolase [Marinihelvus fidelis]